MSALSDRIARLVADAIAGDDVYCELQDVIREVDALCAPVGVEGVAVELEYFADCPSRVLTLAGKLRALAQQPAACGTCEPDGVFDTEGNGPFDCYACGKKAQQPAAVDEAAQGEQQAVAEVVQEWDGVNLRFVSEILPAGTKLYTHPQPVAVAHATAAKDAEIEALRVKVDRYQKRWAENEPAVMYKQRAERLAEMLRKCIDYLPDRGVPGIQKDKARALLRELEEGR